MKNDQHPGEVRYYDHFHGQEQLVRTEKLPLPIDSIWSDIRQSKRVWIVKVVRYYENDGYLYQTEYYDHEDWVIRTEYEPRSNCPK